VLDAVEGWQLFEDKKKAKDIQLSNLEVDNISFVFSKSTEPDTQNQNNNNHESNERKIGGQGEFSEDCTESLHEPAHEEISDDDSHDASPDPQNEEGVEDSE